MRRRCCLIAALWLLLAPVAWGYDLLIVQSRRSPLYDDLLKGMRSKARFSDRTLVLTDYDETDLQRIVREEHPLGVVTLGDSALEAARKLRQVPVVALLSIGFRGQREGHPTMTGVEVQLPPERYLPIFSAIKARRVGVIGSQARSGEYLRLAARVAASRGIDLVVKEAKSPREVPALLNGMAGRIDALWMIPDSVTAAGEAADAHFLFSMGQQIPVVTFSSAYLPAGAAIALEMDPVDIGRQAGEMLDELMGGDGIRGIPPQSPRRGVLKINPAVLRRLGIRADALTGRNAE